VLTQRGDQPRADLALASGCCRSLASSCLHWPAVYSGPSPCALRRALVCVVAVVAFLVPAGSAHAARGMEVALQDDAVFISGRAPGVERGLQLAQGLNVSWIRVNVGWADAATYRVARRRRSPNPVNWNWFPYDRLIDQAAALGINVQLSFSGPAPAWATGNRKIGPRKPRARPFRIFVRDAVLHFRDRVQRYSIWNEPNHTGWISPKRSQPSVYRALYKTGYKTIKSLDPEAQVLIGETSPYANRRATAPITFLRKMARGGLRADGYAHHPYDFNHKPTFRWPGRNNATLGTINNLVRALDQLHRRRALRRPDGGKLNLYLTEYGYIRSGRHGTKESRRRKYAVQAFRIALRHRRVQQMLWYVLARPTRRYRFFDMSLTSAGGSLTPTYRAIARWARSAGAAGQIAVPTPPPPPPPPPPPEGESSGSSSGGSSPPAEGGSGGEQQQPPPCGFPCLPRL
jgi:hypothetical protein